jgi:DNA-binding transcriptional ArsR family regulator
MSPQLIYSVQAELCRAMGNAVRLEIVHLLQGGPLHVGEMARVLGLPQTTISRHIGTLRNLGVVLRERKKEGIFYRIANPKIVKVCELMREILAEQSSDWAQIGAAIHDSDE